MFGRYPSLQGVRTNKGPLHCLPAPWQPESPLKGAFLGKKCLVHRPIKRTKQFFDSSFNETIMVFFFNATIDDYFALVIGQALESIRETNHVISWESCGWKILEEPRTEKPRKLVRLLSKHSPHSKIHGTWQPHCVSPVQRNTILPMRPCDASLASQQVKVQYWW